MNDKKLMKGKEAWQGIVPDHSLEDHLFHFAEHLERQNPEPEGEARDKSNAMRECGGAPQTDKQREIYDHYHHIYRKHRLFERHRTILDLERNDVDRRAQRPSELITHVGEGAKERNEADQAQRERFDARAVAKEVHCPKCHEEPCRSEDWLWDGKNWWHIRLDHVPPYPKVVDGVTIDGIKAVPNNKGRRKKLTNGQTKKPAQP